MLACMHLAMPANCARQAALQVVTPALDQSQWGAASDMSLGALLSWQGLQGLMRVPEGL